MTRTPGVAIDQVCSLKLRPGFHRFFAEVLGPAAKEEAKAIHGGRQQPAGRRW